MFQVFQMPVYAFLLPYLAAFVLVQVPLKTKRALFLVLFDVSPESSSLHPFKMLSPCSLQHCLFCTRIL